MKIVCDSCGAKYSIADEKVRGKVFKIRCKKCSEVIVVRGDGTGETTGPRGGAEPAAAAAAAVPSGGEAIWHLVVGGEQQGPYSPEQISAMLSTGQIDWEAYGWRDGLENWMHLREIDELVTAITGQAPQAAAPAAASSDLFSGGAAAASADAYGGGAAVATGGGGMFASAAAAPAPAARAPAASSRGRGGADLFGGGADDEDVVASKHDAEKAAAADAGVGAMTGARNENSVLFSLSNLQALATKGQAPAATSGVSGGGGGGAKSGFASGSGSGLIDIRALAEGTPGTSSGGGGGSKGIDDLLSIGGPSAFAPSLGAPVLVPARSEGGKLLYVLLGVAALLVLGIIGLVIVIMTKNDTPPVALVAPPPVVQPSAPAPGALPGAAPAAPSSALPAPGASEQPAPEEGGDAAGSEGGRRTGVGGARRTTGGPATPGQTSSGPTKTAELPAAPTKRPDSRTADLDSLIGSALGGATKAPAQNQAVAPAAARGNLPSQPARGDVSSAMGAVTPAVRACAGGQTGTAAIRIVFAGSGRVTTATVTSPPFAGTPAGSCMARAVRGARVPPFSNSNLTVTFPFVVR